jgi:hypothetical protein
MKRVRETIVVEKQNYIFLFVWVCKRARADECMRVCAWGSQEQACDFARVALFIQHENTMRHIVCGFSGSTTFLDIIS